MRNRQPNIYLIGYRCTGKSTIGRELARQRGLAFYDTDEWIMAAEKQTIDEIVTTSGWPHFRALEKACLHTLAQQKGLVIATGGGIILNLANIECMQKNGVVVWLKARPETIIRRMSQDTATAASRPALTHQTREQEVRCTLTARHERYHQAASFACRTDQRSPDALVAQIQTMIP